MPTYHSVFQAIGSYADQTGVFTGGNAAASITSVATQVTGAMPTCSATVWVETGTPSGTFYIDVTDDMRAAPNSGQTANAKWVTVQSVVYTTGVDPNSNGSSQIVWLNGSKFCRARWVFSAGTGTVGVMITGVSS